VFFAAYEPWKVENGKLFCFQLQSDSGDGDEVGYSSELKLSLTVPLWSVWVEVDAKT
jgi:hypothetical protein